MKYVNANDVLPQWLMSEIQRYAGGALLYVPSAQSPKGWGERSGARRYFVSRNAEMRKKREQGLSIEEIAQDYGLAYETVRKIVYGKDEA